MNIKNVIVSKGEDANNRKLQIFTGVVLMIAEATIYFTINLFLPLHNFLLPLSPITAITLKSRL